ncbi:MAG: EamA family transporter [Candidatus Velthaea sp.]
MKRETGASLALAALTLIWGYNWIVVKVATNAADPFIVAAVRNVLGSLVLFAALIVLRKPLASPPVVPTAVLGLLQTFGFMLFQTLAVALGGAGKTAVLVYTMPFWAVAFASVALHERLSRRLAIVLGCAAVGLGFVLVPLDVHAGLVPKALAILSAICWAASVVWAKLLRARFSVDTLTLTTWQLFYGAIPLALVMLAVPQHRLAFTPAFAAAMFYLVVLGALAWLLWMFILSRLSAATAGISSLLVPVVGVLAAWAQLGEVPSATEWVGIAFICAALGLNLAPFRRRAVAPGVSGCAR